MSETITMTAKPIQRTRRLTILDLETLKLPIKIQNNMIMIDRSHKGQKLREPVTLSLEKVLATGEKGLVAYIINALIAERPRLIPFAFENQSVIRMARHFLRHCSGSLQTCYIYTSNLYRYSSWLGYSPDLIIQDLKPAGNIADPTRVQNHAGYLNDYLADLQDEGLRPGGVHGYIKSVKTFYRVNGAKIELSEPLSRRVTNKDRAPKPEELAALLDIAPLRERFMISALALGGFREDTFSKLQYRHVREDLEKNIIPIHVYVEAEITKGKYHDYDTFLGAEAAQFLMLYIEQRKKGTTTSPPENLTDESPLIRDKGSAEPRGIAPKQIYKEIHDLYRKAGLLKKTLGRMYDLRIHSIRKYFKTQLLALGIQPDYVDYMMGHTVDTYDDIQGLGVDHLRGVYVAAGLTIRRKTQIGKVDALKEIIRAWGMNPEEILAKDALLEGATTQRSQEEQENHQLTILRSELKHLIRQETEV